MAHGEQGRGPIGPSEALTSRARPCLEGRLLRSRGLGRLLVALVLVLVFVALVLFVALALVLFVALAGSAYTAEANACSCRKLTAAEGFTSSYAVFTGEVIDIEREAAMSGSIHTKGVLIVSSFLRDRFGVSGYSYMGDAAADLPPLSDETMSAAQSVYDEFIRPHVHQRW